MSAVPRNAPPPLTPELLLAAYAQGYFPMGDEAGTLHWHDPDPRAVLPLEALHPNARLRRAWRSSGLHCTLDQDLTGVMRQCAIVHGDTWITGEMIAAYTALHALGHAHSAETWQDGHLVGGLYGVRIGAAFFGESMFSRVSNASKAALHHLAAHLRERGALLFDTQYINDHTRSLGAVEIPRDVFKTRLATAVNTPFRFHGP